MTSLPGSDTPQGTPHSVRVNVDAPSAFCLYGIASRLV
jgi:hypothetical protein